MVSFRNITAGAGLALLCSAVAFGQAVAPPAGAPAAAPAGEHRNHMDPAAWHKKMCTERLPREAGRLGYMEAKLKLTADQHALFDKWRTTVLDQAKTSEQDCLAHPVDFTKPLAAPDREAMMEKRLETRLAALKAERPSMEALYKSLNPDQKTAFDQPHDRPHGHRGRMGFMPHEQ